MFYVMKKSRLQGSEPQVLLASNEKRCEGFFEGIHTALSTEAGFGKAQIPPLGRYEQIDLDYPHVRMVHPTTITLDFDLYIIRRD